ncbi:MAG: hypothetical protein U5K54_18915 [Cytophagales bacterium]|nr:hypothetical protein [Cytophagales bacterium]
MKREEGKAAYKVFMGGELVVGYSGLNQEYQNGNPMSADFNAPITNNFGSNILQGSILLRSCSNVRPKRNLAAYYH